MHKKPLYLKQKLVLYFDEHFRKDIVDGFKSHKGWKKKCKIFSVYDKGNQKKEDPFQFDYCKKWGYTLVTMDNDFMNDKRYPFSGMPGIVRIVADGNEREKIRNCLDILFSFLYQLPRPRLFMGDTKFQLSLSGCLVRGRDLETGRIKELHLSAGDPLLKLMQGFHYFV